MTLKGIDTSSYQAGLPDKTINADFIIFKATEGVGYTDQDCNPSYQEAKAAGKLLGVYHFARPDGNGAIADIVIVGQTVVGCTVKFGGQFYVVGDVLSADSANIGNAGSGFSITVNEITNTAGTSWLGENYDPVLFYGAMREAMIFMKGEQDMVKYYEDKYQEALAQLKRLGDGLERGDAYRNGQTRMQYNKL